MEEGQRGGKKGEGKEGEGERKKRVKKEGREGQEGKWRWVEKGDKSAKDCTNKRDIKSLHVHSSLYSLTPPLTMIDRKEERRPGTPLSPLSLSRSLISLLSSRRDHSLSLHLPKAATITSGLAG